MKTHALLLLLSLATSYLTIAQEDPNSDLYKTIMSKDSLLFDVGFNTCDISQFEKLYSDDFEFFHDKDSISYKKQFIYNLKNGLCGSPGEYQSRRELVEGSTKIYPLFKDKKIYGAIQIGVHNFYETITGQNEKFASSADFTHVWLLENGDWKLNRSLSYNHKNELIESNINLDDTQELETWLKENNVPVLGLGIINQGKLQEIKIIGDLRLGEKAPYNTIFNVASLTKPITAVVALKLISSGELSLDEPIYKYWIDPDLKNDERVKLLTIRHILSHQTGFPNWRNEKLEFEFTPGTHYQYSGEGFEYLRKILEKKFNKSLNQLATELIFEPLKMEDTKYYWDENTDEDRVVLGYDNKGVSYETYKRKTENGADDLLTTIEDYGTFLIHIMSKEAFSDTIFKEMQENQIATKNGKHFGLGFEKYDFKDGSYALSHGGADKGVQTIVFIFPKTKQGILIFTNVDDGYKVYEKILTHYLGDYGKEIVEIETGKK
ncbi:MAG: class A beta-lactamase-related serine hydrolase [Crocinitomicaceae bacterium]|nr:class A beta-lactamase-related serine hydrolase [Flavobacteriales bacterium]NQZ34097.1 class A beta-lactamase-related serine hydrolase [Crocinitomicaceae bacterium]